MTQERDRWMKCELRTLGRERVGSACSYMSFFDCPTSQFFSMLWYVENLCGTEYVRKGKLKLEATGEKFDFLSLSFLKTGLQFMRCRQFFFSIGIIFKILIFFFLVTQVIFVFSESVFFTKGTVQPTVKILCNLTPTFSFFPFLPSSKLRGLLSIL